MFGYFKIQNHNNKTLRGRLIPPQQDKPLVVFVHGLGGGMFEPQYRALQKSLTQEGFGVCKFDMVNGLGASSKDIHNLSVQDYYQDLLSVLTYITSQGYSDLVLVGHSLGGGLVLKLLESDTTYTSVVVGAVLINPYCSALGTTFEDVQTMIDKIPYRMKRWYHSLELTREFVTKMNQFDTILGAENITTPLFLIHGAHDRTIPEVQSRELRKKLTCPVVFKVYENFGHAFMRPQARKHLPELCNDITLWIKAIKEKK